MCWASGHSGVGQQQLARHPQVDDERLGPVVERHEEELADPARRAEPGAPEPVDRALAAAWRRTVRPPVTATDVDVAGRPRPAPDPRRTTSTSGSSGTFDFATDGRRSAVDGRRGGLGRFGGGHRGRLGLGVPQPLPGHPGGGLLGLLLRAALARAPARALRAARWRRSAWRGRAPRRAPRSGASGRTGGRPAPGGGSCSPARRGPRRRRRSARRAAPSPACRRRPSRRRGTWRPSTASMASARIDGFSRPPESPSPLPSRTNVAELDLGGQLGQHAGVHHRGPDLGQLPLGQVRGTSGRCSR